MKKINLLSFYLFLLLCCVQQVTAAVIDIGPNGCSLKDAVRAANADAPRGNCTTGSGADVIIAPDGWLVELDDTLPTITSDITFQSTTSGGIFYISGSGDHQILKVTGNNTVIFNYVHLIDAKSNFLNGAGGAINAMNATIELNHSLIGSSYIADASGGAIAIYNGVLIINQSKISNTEINSTGAPAIWVVSTVYAVDSDVVITDSSFRFNSNTSLYMSGGNLTVSGSLFYEQRSGIIGLGTVVDISNSTVTPTPSEYSFSALSFRQSSAVNLNQNTIIGDMSVDDSILNISNSIYGECFLENTSVITNSNNLRLYGGNNTPPFDCLPDNERLTGISGLADNGGPTETRALSFNSLAINGGDETRCLAVDQRGVNRIGVCDVGAFEVTGVADIEAQIVISEALPYVGTQPITANLRVINNGPGNASAIKIELDTEHVFIQSVDSNQCASLPCTIDYLEIGQEAYIPVNLITGNPFNSPMSMTLEASSTAASTHTDPNENSDIDNNIYSLELPINQGSDLNIEIELLTAPPYFIGQTINYLATVMNAGQATATQVEFDFIDSGLNSVVVSGCNSLNAQTCTIDTLLNGASQNIKISGKIDEPQFDAIGTVSSDQVDIELSDNIDDQQNNGAISDADIKVSMDIVQAAPYYSYQYLEFNINITAVNDASNIQLWSEFPGAEYIGIGICPSIPCVIPSMAAGTSIDTTFQFFAPIAAPGSSNAMTHRIFASPGQNDPNPDDNEVIISEPLNAASNVGVTLDLVSQPPFYVGQAVEYDLTVYNGGPNDITDVQIIDTPVNLTLSWLAAESCQSLGCTVDQIDLFQNENMTLVYVINEVGTFDLSISANANEIDELPNNNIDSSNNGGIAELLPDDLIFADNFE